MGNIYWIRYLTAVDPLLSTSSAVQTYHHLTSGSVEIPLLNTAKNSSFIGEEPVRFASLVTSSLVTYAVQGIITFTNVLQEHNTVVVVCCTIEWEPDITCTWKQGRKNVVMFMCSICKSQCVRGDNHCIFVSVTNLNPEYGRSEFQGVNKHCI